jgi:tetratricopeptide (TPR) repeat protein
MKFKAVNILLLLTCLCAFSINAAGSRQLSSDSEKITKLLNAHEKAPQNVMINNRLGYLYYLIGKYKNSEYHYKKAISDNPGNIEARLGLYLLSIADKDYEAAEQYCRQISDIDRFNYYGNLYFVNVLNMQGKYSKAAVICNKMLNIYPCNITFLKLLKNTYTYSKESEKAAEVQVRLDLLKN